MAPHNNPGRPWETYPVPAVDILTGFLKPWERPPVDSTVPGIVFYRQT